MVNSNENLKKICSFYVSDWHLVTMLIPYLKEKLAMGANISTILEKSLEENINTLMEKLVININEKNKITAINWKENKNCTEEEIKNKLNKVDNEEQIIIIVGNKEYINKMNNYIEKNIKKNVTIINCFEATQFNESVKEILDKHKYILNTSGEKNIEDVFEMYVS